MQFKHFVIKHLGRITYLASLMRLSCSHVKPRLANNSCEIDVFRPQPVKREDKRFVKRVCVWLKEQSEPSDES